MQPATTEIESTAFAAYDRVRPTFSDAHLVGTVMPVAHPGGIRRRDPCLLIRWDDGREGWWNASSLRKAAPAPRGMILTEAEIAAENASHPVPSVRKFKTGPVLKSKALKARPEREG